MVKKSRHTRKHRHMKHRGGVHPRETIRVNVILKSAQKQKEKEDRERQMRINDFLPKEEEGFQKRRLKSLKARKALATTKTTRRTRRS